ncbi:MAG: hypothetical protein MJZ15_02965 [Bacteroidales bacterium]|nr:hypothetical protein [Bacteroidales bacterium]
MKRLIFMAFCLIGLCGAANAQIFVPAATPPTDNTSSAGLFGMPFTLYSPVTFISTATGLETECNAQVSVVGNAVKLTNVAGQKVELYDLKGVCIKHIDKAEEVEQINVEQRGIYILLVGKAAKKIVLE